MKNWPLLLLLEFLPLHSAAAAPDDNDEEEPCRLWLAHSALTTANSVRYGLYAGVDFDKDDVIPDVELAIPFVDFFVAPNKATTYTAGILSYLEGQLWTTDYARSKFEGNVSATPFVPGIGTLGNYHSLVANANWLQAASFHQARNDDITQPGKPHPSRGAISPFDNMTMVATQKIAAGMEIFPHFGDMWDKEEPSPYQDKLTRKDVVEADQVLDKIVDFFERFDAQMSDELKDDMLDFMLDKVLGAAAGSTRAATIRSLIPQNYRKLRQVREMGGTFAYRNRDNVRSNKWLRKNGVCVDTLYAAKSTLPEAGRGAFASQAFAEGDRITLVPTLLFGQKDLMRMYDLVVVEVPGDGDDDEEVKTEYDYDRSKPRGYQLAMNYALGHAESSLLLLPTAPMLQFVNHHATQANARLQWSTHPVLNNDEATWDHSVQEVMNFRSNMVVLELEALTDIRPGDEVLIDYGPEWEQAWNEYRQLWQDQYQHRPWPLRAADVKRTFQSTTPYPLESSNGAAFLPAGVVTACFIESDHVPDGTPTETDEGVSIFHWVGPVHAHNVTGAQLTLCQLQQVHDDGRGSYNYTVVTHSLEPSDGQYYTTQIEHVPHAAVTLVDAPYTSDLHFPHAFRHWIGIPDDIFPQNWRDQRPER